MANPDKVQTKDGGTIWNHQGYDNYKNASITEEAMHNVNLDSFLDPTGLFKGFWNDLTGVTSQSREFAQQEYLQDKMNAYNTPVQQMARMKEAGINPNLAAEGIAGGGNESAQAPQVASNEGGAAQGLSALGAAAQSVGGAIASAASARETNALLEARKQNIISDTALKLSQKGLNVWTARSVATSLYYLPAEKQADIYLKLAQYNNLKAEYRNIVKEHENIKWDIEQKKASVSLLEHQASVTMEEARFKKAQNDFFEQHGYYSNDPNDVALRNSIVSGNQSEAENIGHAIYEGNFAMRSGDTEAELANIKNRAYQEAAGKLLAKVDEMNKNAEIQKELMKYGIKGEIAKHVTDFLLKYLFGTGFSFSYGPVSVSNSNP